MPCLVRPDATERPRFHRKSCQASNFFGLSRCLDYEIRSADIHQILYEHVFHGHNYIRTISHHLDKKFQQ